jgi:integrase
VNVVQPVRSKEKLAGMEAFLKKRNERDRMLFLVGIYTGLRISDILQLTKENFDGKHIELREGKTRKHRRIQVADVLWRDLKPYLETIEVGAWLFPSRQGGSDKPLSRQRAYAVLRAAARANGIQHFGCHSTRKTFGHFVYTATKDVRLLMEMFNHSKAEITLRYIGATQTELDQAMRGLSLTD